MSVVHDLNEKIESVTSAYLQGKDIEIFELHIVPRKTSLLVQIIVDKPHGGITIDECTDINVYVNTTIEDENIIEDAYEVEVASPGLDRPLKSEKDFIRAQGKEVRFHLTDLIENKCEHHGVVDEVADGKVTVHTKSNTVTIPLDKISKAVQII